MAAYYNEWDKFAAQWLRNLIAAGAIPPGEVDERSIVDVRPDDLRGFSQWHFFAGIGGWPLALRMAGWPNDRQVCTGSCPCQPFSPAALANGGAKGQGDERHLWPHLRRNIRELRPTDILGEQTANAVRWGWWDEVALDLESDGYACAAAILRADAVGADHERKRLYWVAHAGGKGRQGHQPDYRIPGAAQAAFALYGNALADARKALEGDYAHLLSGDGVSVAVERARTHGYGNAIVPQVAAAFIEAVMEIA